MLTTVGFFNCLFGQNQTDTYSPILPETELPFTVSIEQADFSLPNGTHSGAFAVYHDKWVFIAGRTNGLHGFADNNDNFPPQLQNTTVYVVDYKNKVTKSRSLYDPASGLTQTQIDLLSVTSPQYYQKDHKLYITGGYGVDTYTGLFSTKDVLTSVDVPGLIHWVTHQDCDKPLSCHIKQISNPLFQVTGGYMCQFRHHPTLLIFGQNFTGFYYDGSNGDYTQQIRRFHIIDKGDDLAVEILSSIPEIPDPNYRRRDLNVMEAVKHGHGKTELELIALSGVFTLDTGIWTVPVEISVKGKPYMADPSSPKVFKQGMNNYISSALSLYSRKHEDMYMTILGGLTYEYFQNGELMSDSEIPFTNEVTTIKRDCHGNYQQYLVQAEFPQIFSTQSNPGNQLLFGAAAYFIPSDHVELYENGVIKLDEIHKRTVVGYVVGGIQSTVPNTTTITDSAASPYIFKVIVTPQSN